MARESIRIDGIKQFQKALRQMDADLPKQLRVAFNGAAEIVVSAARPRVPRRTGRAAGSLKVRSSQRAGRVASGGRRAPYMPWLDFGGRVGPNRSVRRPFLTRGRFVYRAADDKRPEILDHLSKALGDLARGAGLDVS